MDKNGSDIRGAIVRYRGRRPIGHGGAIYRERIGLIDGDHGRLGIANLDALGVRGHVAATVGGGPGAHQIEGLRAARRGGNLGEVDAHRAAFIGGRHGHRGGNRRATIDRRIGGQ